MIRQLLMAGAPNGGGGPSGPPQSAPLAPGYSTAIPSLDDCVGVTRVGPTRALTTINAAQAYITSQGWSGALGTYWAIIVDPGSYHEVVNVSSGMVLVNANPDVGEVFVHHECPTGWSPINTSGAGWVIAGIKARLDDYPGRTGTGIYDGVHHSSSGAAPVIYERCNFGAFGADLGADTHLYFLDTDIGVGVASPAINIHGAGSNTSPVHVHWIGGACAAPAGYTPIATSNADSIWVIGTDTPSWYVNGATSLTQAHVSPGIPMLGGGTFPGSLDTSGALPVLPVGGVLP